MNWFLETTLKRLNGSGLAELGIRSPFTIPSGIVTTVPSVIARVAKQVPEIGFITTKTLSLEPREGYREPILHEYHLGCYVNAVGLANPGAETFRHKIAPFLPLHDQKPLLVSIMGKDPDEFLQCALMLDPIADAFELNLSCPHVKGVGQAVGSDPETVRSVIKLIKSRLTKPIIPKLSPNLGDIGKMARLCQDEGANALTLINTVGPGVATDADGYPILSNVAGGLSGAGILPVGLKAVREAAQHVTIPIIACGGISSVEHVRAYLAAGALLFGIGSALAGMKTIDIRSFFQKLSQNLETEREDHGQSESLPVQVRTSYIKTQVIENVSIAPGIFQLRLKQGPACGPGQFFFLRIPGMGEKPFSPAWDTEPRYLVRAVGPFTHALKELKAGDRVYIRGPYGNGFPQLLSSDRALLVGGGTGVAPLMMVGMRRRSNVERVFFGFSAQIEEWFRSELIRDIPTAHVVVDPPDRPGEVVRSLAEDMKRKSIMSDNVKVFICGPNPMMQAVLELLAETIPHEQIYLAREDIMRCGIGICGSCGTQRGHRSCVDGPVMHPE